MRVHDHAPARGLTDGCGGCEYLADNPGELGDETLRHLWLADWHQLGDLDKRAREVLSRAVLTTGMLSNAFQYEHYVVATGEGKLSNAFTAGQLMERRGFE